VSLIRRVALVAASALLAGGVSASAGSPTAVPPAGQRMLDDEALMEDEPDCSLAQLTGPAAVSPAAVTGGPTISLDVMVLVDVEAGAAIARLNDPAARGAAESAVYGKVAQRLGAATRSYAPLDISLQVRRYALLQPLVDGKPRVRTTDGQAIIDLARTFLGGRRPAGIDVVYVVTDLDIQSATTGTALAGLADCIGGVAHPDHAFAVGELGADFSIDAGVVQLWPDYAAKVFGHEVGHLLGAHHHYQECGTAAVGASENREVGPCTLMTNLVDFQSFPFSTLNGMVVRGHAEQWAR